MFDKVQTIFLDVDDTLWWFTENSKVALEQAFHDYGGDFWPCDYDAFHAVYLRHNDQLWDQYHHGLIDKDVLVTERFKRFSGEGDLDVAVVKLEHISNFTDFQALTLQKGVRVHYAEKPKDLENADIILLPGTKNTIGDLISLRNRGMDAPIIRHARSGKLLFGICGGYQMLAHRLLDPEHTESNVPEAAGLGLLDMEVTFAPEKLTRQSKAQICAEDGWLSPLKDTILDGYEIHAGHNRYGKECRPWLTIDGHVDGIMNAGGNVLGSYLHGLFDDGSFFGAIASHVRKQEGRQDAAAKPMTLDEFREREFDRIANIVRASLDMEKIYRIIKE